MRHGQTIYKFSILALTTFFGCNSNSQQTISKAQSDNSVKVVGAMRNVMHKGELSGAIDIDTIGNKTNLYGLGPLEGLSGEILLIDGKGYKSAVVMDTTMQVTETFKMKAPFFVYANIYNWTETRLPDSIVTISQLENYLERITKKTQRPFCFRLTATVDSSAIHIVNLPLGSKVSSPEEAHRGQKDYYLINKQVEMVGFFSTEHKGVFTHHDTYVHIHLITADKERMGHLFELKIKSGTARLFLPKE